MSSPDGDIDLDRNPGHGLYFDDTRYLDRDIMRLDGQPLGVLLAQSTGDVSVSELANVEIQLRSAGALSKDRIAITRTRKLGDGMAESIQVRNYAQRALKFTLTIELGCRFDDIFTVRGARPGRRGTVKPPSWKGRHLDLAYEGADGHLRSTIAKFDPTPTSAGGTTASYEIDLAPRKSFEIQMTVDVKDTARRATGNKPSPRRKAEPFQAVAIESDNELFNRCLQRSFADLRMLVMSERGLDFFSAGVPWYVALFGRDSLTTAIETLPFEEHVAADTLRLLAAHQGRHEDDSRDEQPGKIPHELRVGERAKLQEPPPSPYYGTVDATPLFLITLGEYVRWTGDLNTFHDLRSNVDRALTWLDRWADSDGDGLIDYHARSKKGFRNQGWKDSDNCIVNTAGELAEPPIALIEVQGYVYRALLETAALLRATGEIERAAPLEKRARELKQRVADRYWSSKRQYLAMAIARDGRQADAIASNPGQALWTGVVADEHVDAVADGLLSEAMFSGWGIRTLAADERAYNPIDYQVGAVWPHDNALIMAALKRHHRDENAMRVLTGIFESAASFPRYRLPELFAGYSKAAYSMPVRYPVACNPQAWASGALPY
ncbi:MAG TPA: glycogen debranching N-terminal domain-containing protein, partial [Candidatus Dormibacteraeota bacterium]|nr:glycogen debranching N-terminal domain-containing protein [Candidatus Dormibacteraeota bacterium]